MHYCQTVSNFNLTLCFILQNQFVSSSVGVTYDTELQYVISSLLVPTSHSKSFHMSQAYLLLSHIYFRFVNMPLYSSVYILYQSYKYQQQKHVYLNGQVSAVRATHKRKLTRSILTLLATRTSVRQASDHFSDVHMTSRSWSISAVKLFTEFSNFIPEKQ
jgi:hypothetical protein